MFKMRFELAGVFESLSAEDGEMREGQKAKLPDVILMDLDLPLITAGK
jgi:hypothetical protein